MTYIIAHHSFPAVFADEMNIYTNIKDMDTLYIAIVLAARASQR